MITDTFNEVSSASDPRAIAARGKILAERPDLADSKFYQPIAGSNAWTFIVDDEVFKVPKFDDPDNLKNEYKFMQFMHEKDPRVPKVTYISPNNVFFGMEKMPGVTAFEAGVRGEGWLQAEVGAFRASIEEYSLSVDFPSLRLPKENGVSRSFAKALQAPGLCEVYKDYPFVLDHVHAYAERVQARPYVITNGDVDNTGNILVDPEKECVTAFIDFGCLEKKQRPEEGIGDNAMHNNAYTKAQPRVTMEDITLERIARKIEYRMGKYSSGIRPQEVAEQVNMLQKLKNQGLLTPAPKKFSP